MTFVGLEDRYERACLIEFLHYTKIHTSKVIKPEWVAKWIEFILYHLNTTEYHKTIHIYHITAAYPCTTISAHFDLEQIDFLQKKHIGSIFGFFFNYYLDFKLGLVPGAFSNKFFSWIWEIFNDSFGPIVTLKMLLMVWMDWLRSGIKYYVLCIYIIYTYYIFQREVKILKTYQQISFSEICVNFPICFP